MNDKQKDLELPGFPHRNLGMRQAIRLINQPAGVWPLMGDEVLDAITARIDHGRADIKNKLTAIEKRFKPEGFSDKDRDSLEAVLKYFVDLNIDYSTDEFFNNNLLPDDMKAFLASKKSMVSCREQNEVEKEKKGKTKFERLSPHQSIKLLDDVISTAERLITLIKTLHIHQSEKGLQLCQEENKKHDLPVYKDKASHELRCGWPKAILNSPDPKIAITEESLRFFNKLCTPNNYSPLVELIEHADAVKTKCSLARQSGGDQYDAKRDYLIPEAANLYSIISGKETGFDSIKGIYDLVKIVLPDTGIEQIHIETFIRRKQQQCKNVLLSPDKT